MIRGGRELGSRTNYILGTDHPLLQNLAVWDTRPSIDHYLVLGCLRGAAPAAHSRYLGKQTCIPIRPPKTPDGVDRQLSELRGGILNPPWWESPRQACISPETWRLIDTSIVLHQNKDGSQRSSKTLRHNIKVSIQEG